MMTPWRKEERDLVNTKIQEYHDAGMTIIEAIRHIREWAACSLTEAKRVVSTHPAYDATNTLQEELQAAADGDLWLEFICKEGHCGLCGNSGVIDTNTFTSAGVSCGIRGYCICPNGRAKKAGKWPL